MSIVERLFGKRETNENEPQGYTTLSCQSCGWTSGSALLPAKNGNEVKIPQWQINQARDHFLTYRGEDNQELFSGAGQMFGGNKHHCFGVMVAGSENSNYGLVGKPAVVMFDDNGKTKQSNELIVDQ